jgi:hypothetical protein
MIEHSTTTNLRRFALALAGIGVIGTVLELTLVKHYASKDQVIPYVLLGLSALGVIAVVVRPTALVLRVFQGVMIVTILGSGIGMLEHLKANSRNAGAITDSERIPTTPSAILAGIEGFAPLLAPGVLAQVGLLGLAFTYRHPNLQNASNRREGRAETA